MATTMVLVMHRATVMMALVVACGDNMASLPRPASTKASARSSNSDHVHCHLHAPPPQLMHLLRHTTSTACSRLSGKIGAPLSLPKWLTRSMGQSSMGVRWMRRDGGHMCVEQGRRQGQGPPMNVKFPLFL